MKTPILHYVYDALCGWCYGFSPVIQALHARHGARITVEVHAGGMVLGDRVGPIGEVAPYIRWAYKEVEARTGVTFGKAFLEGTLAEGTATFTSLPPARALAVVKADRPELAVAYAAGLQHGIYHDGQLPEEASWYADLAESLGMDRQAFARALADDASLRGAKADMAFAQRMGVQGFPTVFLEQDGSYALLARGYVPLETLEQALLHHTKQEP